MMEQGWKELEYPIDFKWRGHWGRWEGIREIVQNALDESGKVRIQKRNGDLVVFDWGRGLKAQHLILGESDKTSDDARGKFGEGLKIALLVLKRMGHDVHIQSGNLEVRTGTTEIEGRTCLKLMYRERDTTFIPTKVIVKDYDGPTFEDRFRGLSSHDDENVVMEDPRYGQIIDDGESKLYCKDIFVQDMDNARFSYNLNSIQLGEDRSIPNEYSLKKTINKIWGKVSSVSLWRKMIRAVDSGDYYESKISFDPYWFSEASKNALQRAWRGEKGSTTVLYTEDKWKKEAEWRSAKVMRMRSLRKMKNVLPTDEKFVVEKQRKKDVPVEEERLERKQKKNLKRLRIMGEEFQRAKKMTDSFKIDPFILKGANGKAFGDQIRIDIDVLKSFERSVGVLIHEVAHSYYSTKDMTKDHIKGIQKVAGTVINKYPTIEREFKKEGISHSSFREDH